VNRKKIVIVSAVFPPEPVVSANLSYDIANSLSERNDVIVLSPKPSRPYGKNYNLIEEGRNKFEHILLNNFTCPQSKLFGRFKESWSIGKYSAEFVKRNRDSIDVIYANTWPLFGQYFLVKVAKKYKIPILIHIQDIYPESYVKKVPPLLGLIIYHLLLPIDKYVLRNSTKIIGISSNMISYLAKNRKISEEKFHMIRNWQNDEMFLTNNIHIDKAEKPFTFIYLGSISPSAGVDLLIMAFDKAKIPRSRLSIIGSGSQKNYCVDLTKKIGNECIEFSETSPEEVPFCQAQADVLLLPLRKGISKTASPSKMTAYFFSGKPIIACVERDSDVAECITKARCGYVVEPESIDDLANCMKQLSTISKDKRQSMGIGAVDFAKSNLSKAANLQKLVTILERLEW